MSQRYAFIFTQANINDFLHYRILKDASTRNDILRQKAENPFHNDFPVNIPSCIILK